MSEVIHAAEVCRAHLDPSCPACDVEDDDLWVNPNDLTTCGQCQRQFASEISFYAEDDPPLCPVCGDLREDAAECRLCQLSVTTRRDLIAALQARIATNEAEIAEIERGDRHDDYHRRVEIREKQ